MLKVAHNLALALFVASLLVAAVGCETKKPTPATPDAAVAPPPATPTTPAQPDAAAAPAEAAPDAGAVAATDAGAEENKGGGLLPDPDFTLKGPTLKAPTLGGKPGVLGGTDDSAAPEKKPRLLDTELKKD
jgi:hypothetical protein